MASRLKGSGGRPASGNTAASVAGLRTMRMASNGQRTAHNAHPVQSAAPCSCAFLGPHAAVPCTCSDSACGGHTPTHHPQPVQWSVWIKGSALREVFMGLAWPVAGLCLVRWWTCWTLRAWLTMVSINHVAERRNGGIGRVVGKAVPASLVLTDPDAGRLSLCA